MNDKVGEKREWLKIFVSSLSALKCGDDEMASTDLISGTEWVKGSQKLSHWRKEANNLWIVWIWQGTTMEEEHKEGWNCKSEV